jgi:tripartite-type tricarboxylate transporter receptor subunit TctC
MGVVRGLAGGFMAAFTCTAIAIGGAAADDWPARPATMVIPFGAGSGIDVLGRVLAPAMAEKLGQPIVVENVGGAGGMTGTARVAKAAPDGYAFVLGNVGTHAVNQSLYAHPLYDAGRDFAPVAAVADTPQVLIARKDLPADGLQGFIGHVKANHAKMQYGSPGAGSAAHLACALLNAAIGVDVTHVPYRGGGPAMQDLIAGRIDYQCPLVALALPHIESGQVKAIAAMSARRSASLPQLGTAQEQGLAGFEVATWNALFLPKGTPAAIVRKLHDAADAALERPDIQARLRQIGAEPTSHEDRSPEFLQKFVGREISKWAGAIKAAGLSAQ